MGLHQQARHGQKAASLIGSDALPVAALDGRGGRGIQTARDGIVVIVREIGTDYDQGFRPAPQPPQRGRGLLWNRIADQQRHHGEGTQQCLEEG
jgi:hypothetical protein